MAPIWTFLRPANVDTITPFSLMCSCNCPAQQVQLNNPIFAQQHIHPPVVVRTIQPFLREFNFRCPVCLVHENSPQRHLYFLFKWIIDQSNSPTKDLGAKHTKLEAVENRSNLFFQFPPNPQIDLLLASRFTSPPLLSCICLCLKSPHQIIV